MKLQPVAEPGFRPGRGDDAPLVLVEQGRESLENFETQRSRLFIALAVTENESVDHLRGGRRRKQDDFRHLGAEHLAELHQQLGDGGLLRRLLQHIAGPVQVLQTLVLLMLPRVEPVRSAQCRDRRQQKQYLDGVARHRRDHLEAEAGIGHSADEHDRQRQQPLTPFQ